MDQEFQELLNDEFGLIKLTKACEIAGISYSKGSKDAAKRVFDVVQFSSKGTLFINFKTWYNQYIKANTINKTTTLKSAKIPA